MSVNDICRWYDPKSRSAKLMAPPEPRLCAAPPHPPPLFRLLDLPLPRVHLTVASNDVLIRR